ncbi:MAG: hypothetical protein ACE5HI_07060 [bacterium]
MHDESLYLSIYSESPRTEPDGLAIKLQKHFKTLTVSTRNELNMLLKSHQVFCSLICCNLRDAEDLSGIYEISRAFQKLPAVVYGRVDAPQLYLELGKNGVRKCIPRGEHELLVRTLHELKERATFRIDLRDFGVEVDQCQNYWCRRFCDFILEDDNFLKYRTVDEVCRQMHTSGSNLDQVMRNERWLSPKQLLLCLRNYYAAYLLETTHWSTIVVARKMWIS